jgi:hypothetical protein
VAELVDALASGASGGNPVEVQVLFWAPINYLGLRIDSSQERAEYILLSDKGDNVRASTGIFIDLKSND